MAKLDYEQILHKPNLREAARRSKNPSQIVYDDFSIPSEVENYGVGKKYYVCTYGCQANERDGETIIGILEKMGYTPTENMDEADIAILNTCAIRENAVDRVFGEIGHLKAAKRVKPDAIYAICGCMVQEEVVTKRIYEKCPHIDLVFGTHNIHKLPQLILDVITKQTRIIEVFSCEGEVIENTPVKRLNNLKAWVNIMYGCDKFCTYCIVPYTRGKERSRLKKDILKEVQELKEQGYQEITLLGQNVNAYGKDLKEDNGDFGQLLEDVAKIGIPRVRFVTSHPWNFTDHMIETIAKYDNLMPFIHLPLQSGDDEILRRMGRRYTKEKYIALYNKIRETIPGVSITTDIIVGFPNESEEAFKNTLEVVDTCHFDAAFTFIFSPREGTPAARMEDSIDMETKHRRLEELITHINKDALARNESYVGKVVKVLVEGSSKRNDNILSGYSESQKLVNFKGNPNSIGKIVNVLITKAKTFTIEGEEVE